MNLEKMYEDRFGRFPLSNSTTYLIFGQVVAYVFTILYPGMYDHLVLRGSAILSGEWWRVFTFLFAPFLLSPIWLVLEWYFMYMIGSALEAIWGAFRYAEYLTVATVATIILSFIFPNQTFSNGFIYTSIFLAFANLNPNFTLLLFFIIPVKIKWLALLTWIGYGIALIFGPMSNRILVMLSISNFLIFFWEELWQIAQSRLHSKTKSVMKIDQTYMKCVTCGATENNRKIFYTCRECIPVQQYCDDHIKIHTHKIIN